MAVEAEDAEDDPVGEEEVEDDTEITTRREKHTNKGKHRHFTHNLI